MTDKFEMNIPKRVLSLLALFLGFVGLIGCIALAVGVWIGGARLRSATENLFGKIDEAVQLTLRLLATFSSIDARLARIQKRVFETQEEVRGRKATTDRSIFTATIIASLLMAWMAAGQFCLCFHGWKALRGRRTSRRPDGSTITASL